MNATKNISAGQFATFRILFGIYLTWHFLALVPYAPELFGNQGVLPQASLNLTYRAFPNLLALLDSPVQTQIFLGALGAIAVSFTLGWHRRTCALLLWYGWACLFNRNNLITNPGIPYVGLLLIFSALLPRASKWSMPAYIFWGAWFLMAAGYTYSGAWKLISPSWQDGSALWHLLMNPLARPGVCRDLLLALPWPFLSALTWIALLGELLFLPLCAHARGRFIAWTWMLLMHLGVLLVVDFADLTFGVLMIHLFTFDPDWLQAPGLKSRSAWHKRDRGRFSEHALQIFAVLLNGRRGRALLMLAHCKRLSVKGTDTMKGKIRFNWAIALFAAIGLCISSAAAQRVTNNENVTNKTTRATSSAREAKSQKINLNTASKAELESLPGVGPSTADNIIAARPIKNVTQLKDVSGIGKERLKDLRPLVTVGTAADRRANGADSQSRASTSRTTGSDKPTAEAQSRNVTPRGSRPAAGGGTRVETDSVHSGSDKPGAREKEESRASRPRNRTEDTRTENRGARDQENSSARTAGAKVNVNTASLEQLESLLGIGPVKAQAIIDNRPYSKAEDLMNVKGIKEGTYDQIRDQITVR